MIRRIALWLGKYIESERKVQKVECGAPICAGEESERFSWSPSRALPEIVVH
jgi:hypothetical protein